MCHRQAAISSASYPAADARPFVREGAAPAAAAPSSDKVYTGQVKLGVKPCRTTRNIHFLTPEDADVGKLQYSNSGKCNLFDFSGLASFRSRYQHDGGFMDVR